MASNLDPVDPVDEEIEAALADPEIRARLEAFVRRAERGELGPGVSHEEVRRRFGLPPLDDAEA